jgi:hypothetical protein
MEARTGDRAKAEAVANIAKSDKPVPPRDRLLPLSYVEFSKPVNFAGLPHPLRKFTRGTLLPETQKLCPKLFLDPELQAVVIEGRHFPIHLVDCYERAKAA